MRHEPPSTFLLDVNSAPSLYPKTYSLKVRFRIVNYLLRCKKSLTLSQSSFCLVRGNARRNPLKVFSAISWYASFSKIWYFPSSFSINASNFSAFCFGDDEDIADGIGKEESWFVDNCTCMNWNAGSFLKKNKWGSKVTDVSLFIVVNIDQDPSFDKPFLQVYFILGTPSPWPLWKRQQIWLVFNCALRTNSFVDYTYLRQSEW